MISPEMTSVPTEATTPFTPEAVVRRFSKVLLVDDSKFLSDILGTFFQLDGFIARSTYGGHEALTACEDELPDIAFIDLSMPDLDGMEVARRIKATHGAGAPVLVALTGCDDPLSRVAASEAGFEFFLEKPVDPASLRRFMSSLMESRAGLGEAS